MSVFAATVVVCKGCGKALGVEGYYQVCWCKTPSAPVVFVPVVVPLA